MGALAPVPKAVSGIDLIDIPAYSSSAVAHHLHLPEATVRGWAFGRGRKVRPVIVAADPKARLLSFRNLTELHVLGVFRRQHGVTLGAIRGALAYLRDQFGSEHPLADEQMLTDGKSLMVKRLEKLINVSRHGQLEVEHLLDSYLQRIERDGASRKPARLYPFTRPGLDGPRLVVIDPRVQFGRPCLAGTGVPTDVLVQRFRAGESIGELAKDYRRKVEEVEEAIRYEAERKAA